MDTGKEIVIINSALSLSGGGPGGRRGAGCLTVNFVSGRGVGHELRK